MINRIIGDDEESRREFEAYLKVWEKSADLQDFDEIDAASDWTKVRSRMKVFRTRQRIPFRSFALRIAAVFILALGLTYFLSQVLKQTTEGVKENIEVVAGNSITLELLDDGTQISLNKGAKIIYNEEYGKSNRDIYLQGEAFFTVARNESLPFRVFATNSVIEVLGTSFCVREEVDEIVVGVVSGKVALYEKDDTTNRVSLLADQTGIFSIGAAEINTRDALDRNSITWHTHRFFFDDLPLDEVGRILANYYDLELDIDGDIENFPTVRLKDLFAEPFEEVIDQINLTLTRDVRIIVDKESLIVSKQ